MIARSFTGPCFNNWLFFQRHHGRLEGEHYRPSDQAKEVGDAFEQGIVLQS